MANATKNHDLAALKASDNNDVHWIDVALGIVAIVIVIAGLIAAQYGPPVEDAHLYNPATGMTLWPF